MWKGLKRYGKRSKVGLPLLVFLLGFLVPLFGESLSLEGVTLSPQEWVTLQEEFNGLKIDISELQTINESQQNSIVELENLLQSSESIQDKQNLLLKEQSNELSELKISSLELTDALSRQTRATNLWRTGALIGGGVALGLGVVALILGLYPRTP